MGLALYAVWDLTLITLATLPVSAVVMAWISARMQPSIDAQAKQLGIAAKYANNALQAIATVKSLNGQDFEIWQYAKAVKKAAKKYLIQANINSFQIGFVRLVTLSMFVQGFWYGSHLVQKGKKDPGQVLMAFWASLMATQAVEQILPQMIILEKGKAAGATMKAILTSMGRRRNLILNGEAVPDFCEGDIEIRNVRLVLTQAIIGKLTIPGLFPIPFPSESPRPGQCLFFLPGWRDDVCDWEERIRQEHPWQFANALLRTTLGRGYH